MILVIIPAPMLPRDRSEPWLLLLLPALKVLAVLAHMPKETSQVLR